MTRFPDLFADLAAPFESRDVKTRVQGNLRFPYITARTAMNRLDEVVGPENWWDDYEHNEQSVVCRLTLRLPDGTTVTKCDAGGYAGMADSGDDEKSAFSDAFKRAAAKFGVGRHLYGDGIPAFRRMLRDDQPEAQETPAASQTRSGEGRSASQGASRPAAASGGASTPPAPSETAPASTTPRRERRTTANPRGAQSEGEASQTGSASTGETQGASTVETTTAGVVRMERDADTGGGGSRGGFVPPRTGRALFGWAREIDQRSKADLIRHLSTWGRHHEFPDRIVDWDGEQVRQAYDEAMRKLSEQGATAIPA